MEMKNCIILVVAMMLVTTLSAQANLINNPGFEQDMTWTWSAEGERTNWFAWGEVQQADSGWVAPQEGSYSMVFKNWNGTGGGIEQKPSVSAESTYELSLYRLVDDGFDGTVNLEFRWLDASYASLGAGSTNSFVMPTAGSEETWYSYTAVVTSMVGSANVEINMDNPAGGTAGTYYVDAVDFDVQAIPEPATALLLALGCGMLVWVRRNKC